MDMISTINPAAEEARIAELHKAQTTSTSSGDNEMFQELFLAQLEHQDPMNPMDNDQFLSQMAQFNSLEQLQGINDKLSALEEGSQSSIGEASNLIGKIVSGISKDSLQQIGGLVDSINVDSGEIFLNIGNDRLKMEDIISVTSADQLFSQIY